MQPDVLSKFCFGLGLTTAVAKGMLFWSVGRFYESSNVTLGSSPAETFEPAIILISVVALAGIIGTALAFAKGARGQLVYVAFVLNGVALLANPMG